MIPGSGCRYHPSCSCFTATALARFGFFKGGWMGFRRICRCHPWGGSGVDEVPER
jgi:putative membrane protein insertion efficiency factor